MRLLLILVTLTAVAMARPANWPPATYAIYYGPWNDTVIQQAWSFDLIVLHPGAGLDNLTPAQARKLRSGKDGQPNTADDVLALGYVSLGEDERPPAGPPQLGLTGPVHGASLAPGTGYPSRFLDEVAYIPEGNFIKLGPDGKAVTRKGQDGLPDENGVWGSYYVNPADPEWKRMVLQRTARIANELGLDGFFWDTLDTASPWGNYAFTQAAMAELLQTLRKTYPTKITIGNRGMFLLDSHAAAYKSSLDGLLFESFLTEWDWQRKVGQTSAYLKSNEEVLKNQVIPSGLALFFVNYLSPQQSDLATLLHTNADLLKGVKNSSYFADPLLQTLYPPFAALFPPTGKGPMPTMSSLKAHDRGLGRFELTWELTNPAQLGWVDDLYLDVRYSATPVTDIASLPSLPVKYPVTRFESYGLEPAKRYTFYVRLVGKARNQVTPWAQATLTTPKGTATTELTAESRERSVVLHWKGEAKSYDVYYGTEPFDLKKLTTVDKPGFQVTGLQNGRTLYYAVAPEHGWMSRPVLSYASDCTPPASPANVAATRELKDVKITWTPVADAASFRVYLVPTGQAYGIPLLVSEGGAATMKQVSPGTYDAFVTSVDGAGNESKPASRVAVQVPGYSLEELFEDRLRGLFPLRWVCGLALLVDDLPDP